MSNPSIKEVVDKIVEEVSTYESNTFSASHYKLNAKEARMIAALVIQRAFNVYGLDGYDMQEMLESVRDDEE